MQTPDLSFLHYVNELIAINNERFKTYSRAMEKTHDSTFRSLCAQNKERTVHFNMQLIRCLVSYNQLPLHTETDLGKAYHFGMVRRFRFLLRLRRVNRNACLWWDSIALRAYKHVLEELQYVPGEIKRVILQQQSIQESDRRYSGIAL